MEENKVDTNDIKIVESKNEIVTADEAKVTSKKYRRKRRKPGFHEDMFNETSYYFKEGLQYVYPYTFTFTAYIKERWFNMPVLDLFRKEFHLETMEYYEKAIKVGKVKVNNKIVSSEKLLKNNEILQTTVHRHEPPVIHQDIEFVQNDDDMVVINKPSSIPVHPCGRYRHNTIVFILGKVYNLTGLHTIHRIDRLTSGILMFAKTPAKAREIENQIHHKKNVAKEYVARVIGEFPVGEITVDKPILTASHKIGVCHVHAEGKECSTTFNRLSYNGKSSLVSCKPHTGRMHQIRVHLKWLGHPIINDPIYNHPTAWGKNKGEYNIDEVISELLRTRKDISYDYDLRTDKSDTKCEINIPDNSLGSSIEKDNGSPSNKRRKVEVDNEQTIPVGNDIPLNDIDNENISIPCNPSITVDNTDVCNSNPCNQNFTNKPAVTSDLNCEKNNIVNNSEEERVYYTSSDIGEEYVDEDCSDCKRKWQQPFRSELVMYLHALSYNGPDWEYKTSLPLWAEESWDYD